jgi:hypothetical protein
MKIEPKDNCPLDNFNPCRQLNCAWFLKINGKNPNTGADIDDWGCSMAWMPILMIENSQQQRSTGAAVESFRNEMVKSNEMNTKIMLTQLTQKENIEILPLEHKGHA